MLTNCSVGKEDKNLWLYEVSKNGFSCLDAKNLVENMNLEQVFSFDVNCFLKGNQLYFFCSTQEGLLWFGDVETGVLKVMGSLKISSHGGAVIAVFPLDKQLILVINDVILLDVIEGQN